MGHDSERAAIIYQHEAAAPMRPSLMRSTLTWSLSRAREAVTVALPGLSCMRANGTLMAHGRLRGFYGPGVRDWREPLTWGFLVERVTGIEPALSAWEVCGAVALPPADSVTCGDLGGLSLSDRDCPRVLLPSGTQRARCARITRMSLCDASSAATSHGWHLGRAGAGHHQRARGGAWMRGCQAATAASCCAHRQPKKLDETAHMCSQAGNVS